MIAKKTKASKLLADIPTHIIMGFLGVGKTTAILNLLKQKPAGEKWAVLVNEVGQIGLDGDIYQAAGVTVKEIAGGCLCCALGLPFEVSINQLLKQTRPDRLFIEPTGLGHPKKVLDRLLNRIAPGVLDVKAGICLVDPAHFNNPEYLQHANFVDQIMMADIVVANKTDLADEQAMTAFYQWIENCQPPKDIVAETIQAELDIAWLDMKRSPERVAKYPDAHAEQGADEGYLMQGYVFDRQDRFDYEKLIALCQSMKVERLKAIMHTDKGWLLLNQSGKALTVTAVEPSEQNKIEVISGQNTEDNLKKLILSCRKN